MKHIGYLPTAPLKYKLLNTDKQYILIEKYGLDSGTITLSTVEIPYLKTLLPDKGIETLIKKINKHILVDISIIY